MDVFVALSKATFAENLHIVLSSPDEKAFIFNLLCVLICFIPDNKASVGNPAPRRLRFSPPTGSFTLCHYSASRLQELPIFGSFTMKVRMASDKNNKHNGASLDTS